MPFPEPPPDAVWVDDDAGPVVRPYAMTSGRTRPTKGKFDLVSLIVATRPASALGAGYSPEHVSIIQMSQRPISVAEVAAHLDLPISVVRVFLGDLLHAELIVVRHAQLVDPQYSDVHFEAMLDGLRAL